MTHLPDYVKWRGDLSFGERGFRIEDNLVLSELVYINYKPALEGGVSLSLREAIAELDQKGVLENTRAGSGAEDEDFARDCAASKRFGEVQLVDFKDIFDSSDRQFAAVTYILDDGTTVIGFRGTDSTIIGWKEDFMISYTNVPSQDLALEYAQKHVDAADGKVVILGHSKGAHLALFAAAHLDERQQEKVVRVYMNDGPGFCEDVLNRSLVEGIRDKLTKITPEYSIIGRLFEPDAGENIIVRSTAKAMIQHSMQTWLLNDGNGLVTCADHAPESHLLNDSIEKFVNSMDLDARENFIEVLFGSMADTGARTIKEFASQGPAAFEELLVKMAGNDVLNIKGKARKIKKRDDDSKGLYVRLWGLINRKQLVRIAISLILSAACFAFPDFAMESLVFLVLVVTCIYEVVLTIRHLKSSHWNFRKERPRVMLCIVLWVMTSVVLVKQDALFVISSMILGVTLLSLAYQNIINFRIYNDKFFERFRYSFEGIVTLLLGGYILVVPDIANSWYMLSCGNLLLIDAIFETLKMIRDHRKNRVEGRS
jgi:uncharacterized membrane protein HdeD (DUF308 family)